MHLDYAGRESILLEDKDVISLTVNFQTLPDGTNYTPEQVLDEAAKKIVVNVDGSNYQKIAN